MNVDWREQAACRTYPVDFMYPERGDTVAQDAAKALCATCPVQYPCLVQAIKDGEREGYFGGLSARERRVLRRVDHVIVRCAWPSCGKEFGQKQKQIVCCSEECNRLRRNLYRKNHSKASHLKRLYES